MARPYDLKLTPSIPAPHGELAVSAVDSLSSTESPKMAPPFDPKLNPRFPKPVLPVDQKDLNHPAPTTPTSQAVTKHLNNEIKPKTCKVGIGHYLHLDKTNRIQILADRNVDSKMIKQMTQKFWSRRTHIAHDFQGFCLLAIEMNTRSSLSQRWLYQEMCQ